MTRQEIKEVFLHVAVYCGAPAALDSFRIAKKIFSESEPLRPAGARASSSPRAAR